MTATAPIVAAAIIVAAVAESTRVVFGAELADVVAGRYPYDAEPMFPLVLDDATARIAR